MRRLVFFCSVLLLFISSFFLAQSLGHAVWSSLRVDALAFANASDCQGRPLMVRIFSALWHPSGCAQQPSHLPGESGRAPTRFRSAHHSTGPMLVRERDRQGAYCIDWQAGQKNCSCASPITPLRLTTHQFRHTRSRSCQLHG